jgi:hypothetical protein
MVSATKVAKTFERGNRPLPGLTEIGTIEFFWQ